MLLLHSILRALNEGNAAANLAQSRNFNAQRAIL
jgi:hypothetical protein